MSFTSELKSELMRNPPRDERTVRAELSGIFSSEAHFRMTEDEIACRIRTDNAELARYIKSQIESTFSLSGDLIAEESKRFGKHTAYELVYENAAEFLRATETVKKGNFGFYNPILNTIFDEEESLKAAFLRGIFLGCGSVSDPSHTYHLEIDAPNGAITETCADLLEEFEINAHLLEKKNRSILYLKDFQSILSFFNLIGAENAENLLISAVELKQMRGEINRQVNCETANMRKVALAAGNEIEAIEALIESGTFSKLDPKLQQAALLRLDYPSLSISALSELSDPPVSRSTFYRRLKQIQKIREEMKD